MEYVEYSGSQHYDLHNIRWISVSMSVKSSCRFRGSLSFLLPLRVYYSTTTETSKVNPAADETQKAQEQPSLPVGEG